MSEPTQALDTGRKDKIAKQRAREMIDRQMNPSSPLDLSKDDGIAAILADSSKMDALLEHLQLVNELDDQALEPVRSHYGLASEIAKIEELKKQAAIDEDYENAANYKKQIIKLKSEELTTERLKAEYLERLPTMRVKKMFEMLCEIDPAFTKKLLAAQQNGAPKLSQRQVLNKLLVLQ